MDSNILSFASIARKAGRLKLGCDNIVSAAGTRRVKLVLASSDISENTMSEIGQICGRKDIPVVRVDFSKGEMGKAFGLQSCAAIGFTDAGFAKAAAQKIGDDELLEKLSANEQRAARRLAKKHRGKSNM